ncbi:MAG: ABC transporter substrate-binding protein [Pseudomonadota bacterium]|nr:ABC transporter substrate-binding protein [Pseudomonadota bacterium]MEE3099059.1 ABC transporter substrate-binding protein [Pseudomonadota bacterium]
MIGRRAFLSRAGTAAGAAALAGALPAALLPRAGRAAEASRVIVAGGDLTEIAFALGAGGRIAGVDSTSTYPAEAASLPQVGYLRRLAPEGLLSLAPDLLIAAPDAGPPEALAALSAAGVTVETGPEGEGPEVVPLKIAFMGRALGREAEAEALAADFSARMARLEEALAVVGDRPTVLCLLTAGRGAPMAAGEGTAAAAMIALARGRNAVTGYEGYRPLSAEAAVAAAPDVLLLPAHAAAAMGGADAALDRPEIAATPAGRARRAVTMDGMALLGFGLRTPEAAAELARALHPDLPLDPDLAPGLPG